MSSDSSTDGNYEMGEKYNPRYVNKSTRPDGSTSIVYGNKRDDDGKIIAEHGHGVNNSDGSLAYSRGQDGTVRYDDNNLNSKDNGK